MNKKAQILEDLNGNYELGSQNSTKILEDIICRPQQTPSKTTTINHDRLEPNNAEHDINDPGDKLCCPIPPLAQHHHSTDLAPSPVFNSQRLSCLRGCHLKSVLSSAQRCLHQLNSVKTNLSVLVLGETGTCDYELVSRLAECIGSLSTQAFTPAHQMYTAALGLHLSEDLIRNPQDPKLLDFSKGYVVRLPWTCILHAQIKLRSCVDAATQVLHRFESGSADLQEIMLTVMHAFQDLYATSLGCNDVIKGLVHVEGFGGKMLLEFIQGMGSAARSELLIQVQALRRSFDDIVIRLERLSWAAYAVERLAKEKLDPIDQQRAGSRSCSKSRKVVEHDGEADFPVSDVEDGGRSRSRSRKNRRFEADEESSKPDGSDDEEFVSSRTSKHSRTRSKTPRLEEEEEEEAFEDSQYKRSKSKSKSRSKAEDTEKDHKKLGRNQSRSAERRHQEEQDWSSDRCSSEHRKSKKGRSLEREKGSGISFKALSGGGKNSSKSHKNKTANGSREKQKKK